MLNLRAQKGWTTKFIESSQMFGKRDGWMIVFERPVPEDSS